MVKTDLAGRRSYARATARNISARTGTKTVVKYSGSGGSTETVTATPSKTATGGVKVSTPTTETLKTDSQKFVTTASKDSTSPTSSQQKSVREQVAQEIIRSPTTKTYDPDTGMYRYETSTSFAQEMRASKVKSLSPDVKIRRTGGSPVSKTPIMVTSSPDLTFIDKGKEVIQEQYAKVSKPAKDYIVPLIVPSKEPAYELFGKATKKAQDIYFEYAPEKVQRTVSQSVGVGFPTFNISPIELKSYAIRVKESDKQLFGLPILTERTKEFIPTTAPELARKGSKVATQIYTAVVGGGAVYSGLSAVGKTAISTGIAAKGGYDIYTGETIEEKAIGGAELAVGLYGIGREAYKPIKSKTQKIEIKGETYQRSTSKVKGEKVSVKSIGEFEGSARKYQEIELFGKKIKWGKVDYPTVKGQVQYVGSDKTYDLGIKASLKDIKGREFVYTGSGRGFVTDKKGVEVFNLIGKQKGTSDFIFSGGGRGFEVRTGGKYASQGVTGSTYEVSTGTKTGSIITGKPITLSEEIGTRQVAKGSYSYSLDVGESFKYIDPVSKKTVIERFGKASTKTATKKYFDVFEELAPKKVKVYGSDVLSIGLTTPPQTVLVKPVLSTPTTLLKPSPADLLVGAVDKSFITSTTGSSIIGAGAGLISIPKPKTKITPLTETRSSFSLDYEPITRQSPSTRTKVRSLLEVSPASSTITESRLITGGITEIIPKIDIPVPVPIIPTPPPVIPSPKIPPTPIRIPDLDFIFKPKRRIRTPKIRGRPMKGRYKPSLFGIETGKTISKAPSLTTAIGIRFPVAKKRKTKKKGKKKKKK